MERERVRKSWIVSAIVVGIMGLFMYSNSAVVAAPSQEVLIGSLQPLTGVAALTGEDMRMIIDYAIDEINASGGIKSMGGAKLRVIHGDDQSNPQIGIAQAERLIREGVSLILGPQFSGISLVVTQVCEKSKVPILITNAVADEITQRGFKYTFRSLPPSSWIVRDGFPMIMEVAKKNNAMFKTMALIYENSAYGTGIAEFMKQACNKEGVKVLADISYDMKSVDFSSEVLKIKSANPDVIANCSYAGDGVLLLKTMREQQIRPMARMSMADACFLTTKAYREGLGDYSNYNCGISTYGMNRNDPRYKPLYERFLKRFNRTLDIQSEVRYFGVYVVKEVLELAGSSDREKIRDAFTRLNYRNHMMCAEGPVRFNSDGQNISATAYMQQYFPDNVTPLIVMPAKYRQREAVFPHPDYKKQ